MKKNKLFVYEGTKWDSSFEILNTGNCINRTTHIPGIENFTWKDYVFRTLRSKV